MPDVEKSRTTVGQVDDAQRDTRPSASFALRMMADDGAACVDGVCALPEPSRTDP